MAATYRVQLGPDLTFENVCGHLDRLARLGITHLYLSPVTEAVPGSPHGYDVVDHARVREELGGYDGLLALLDRAAQRSMLVILDHVANHASVAVPRLNRPWWTMLRDGRDSAAARWFDVDWEAADGRVCLPVIDSPVDELIASERVRLCVGDGQQPELDVDGLRLPLAAGTAGGPIDEVLAAQHYRLLRWRDSFRNVRRFFTIDDLVAVRVEEPHVAEVVDTVPRLFSSHPGFGGVRVDHVDGLTDPLTYLCGLRDVLGDYRLLIVEKILAPGETLPMAWPVDGTTGYEHARVMDHALVDGDGVRALTAAWRRSTGDDEPFDAQETRARREVFTDGLAADVARVSRRAGIREEVVIALSVHLGRYRTYLPDDPGARRAIEQALADASTAVGDLAPELEQMAESLLDGSGTDAAELRRRWQQLTGPGVAKGVEDRLFYRYLPVSALCEVGGDPGRWETGSTPHADAEATSPGDANRMTDESDRSGDAIAELHEHHLVTQHRWPSTLLAGTTHDTKRSEDVRARGLALSARAAEWPAVVEAFTERRGAGGADPAMTWLALQTGVTAWPLPADRLGDYLVKAAREADVATSWIRPDAAYEEALRRLASRVCNEIAEPATPAARLTAALQCDGRAVALAMLAIRLTAPGIPDLYQGTEMERLLLVDPDNRRPPPWDEIEAAVVAARDTDAAAAWAASGSSMARTVLIDRLLALRRRLPDAFDAGAAYAPLAQQLAGVIGFTRTSSDGDARVVTLAPRAASVVAPPDEPVSLPAGRWWHVLVDDLPPFETAVNLGELWAPLPVAVLTDQPHER